MSLMTAKEIMQIIPHRQPFMLIDTIEEQLLALTGEEKKIESVSIAKLKEMQERLSSGYTSFWS